MSEIRAVARHIGREFRPRRVILFGSYARGAVTADSDVDLLVIMPFQGHAAYKATEIRLRVNPRFPVDLLVRTPQMVRQRVAMGDCFMKEVLREGKVLYAGNHRRVGGQGRRGLLHPRARVPRAKESRV